MMRQLNRSTIDMTALLRHSLATAVAAESLARIKHEPLASEAFIAGLLHNLGVAVQVYIDPAGVNAMIEARRTDGARNIRLLESDHSCVRHEECIAVIFDAWQLPASLLAAVAHHHDPNDAPSAHRQLTGLVHMGGALAVACGHTFSLEAGVDHDLRAAELLDLTPDDLRRAASDLSTRVQSLRGALV
jgi:HD-like signal output (HDOD) protein